MNHSAVAAINYFEHQDQVKKKDSSNVYTIMYM